MTESGPSNESGFALFATPVGDCGIAWRPSGLVALQLPSSSKDAAAARLRRRAPELEPASPPPWVAEVIARIRAMMAGEPIDLGDVPLDFSGVGAFEAAVYREARRIPLGTTVTYGELAVRLGDRNHARAVGQALGRNPWPIVVPCHRITAAEGRTGGFSAPGGTATKLKLLEMEGALKPETLPLFSG